MNIKREDVRDVIYPEKPIDWNNDTGDYVARILVNGALVDMWFNVYEIRIGENVIKMRDLPEAYARTFNPIK